MRVNLFAGSRRIAVLVGVAWALGCLAFALNREPHVSTHLLVPGMGKEQRWVDHCEPQDATSYRTIEYGQAKVSVTICFLALLDGGAWRIPYRDASSGIWWLGDKYSPDVAVYQTALAERLYLDAETIPGIKEKVRRQRAEIWGEAAGSLLGGWFILWLSAACIGWVARGFLGIPRGKDEAAT